ncbi:glycerophosphodiester phosphodiesterase [Ruania alba]|uniref:glycerophosphodiester phosphodiesterase n=1 Tax=Ruania alba TaxID=648782 RepID=UPI001FDF06F7|nr:glycerophosphodiester phosphodiesterase family protein [Ruania alba]
MVAHRGNASVAPGNTMPAVEGAWRAGADLVEVDVRMSADGVPVVIHDATVDATTTGAGEVAGMTGAQARELDAGSWFSPVFAAHRVPLLADVARFLSDHDGTDLLLEVKGDLTVVQATVVLATLDAAGMRERTIVQTFWPQTIRALRAVDPAMRLGLLVGSHVAPNEVMFLLSAEVGAMACNPRYDLLAEDPNLVQAIHDAGMRVFVWTLNEAAAWEEAVAWGVDGIITDRPDRLAGWLSARGVERSAPEAV